MNMTFRKSNFNEPKNPIGLAARGRRQLCGFTITLRHISSLYFIWRHLNMYAQIHYLLFHCNCVFGTTQIVKMWKSKWLIQRLSLMKIKKQMSADDAYILRHFISDVGTFNGFCRHFCWNQSELGFNIRTKKAASLFRFCLWCFNFTMWRAFDFIHKMARKMQKGFSISIE